ncbi:hypothetical protein ACI1MP_38115 (plasmid) [Kitasatospora griseola]|uniref:hypothetical protein n=1 Tax=Kitasatospora griseola TaxID=2064 RepID=UPI003855AACF
MKFKAGDEVLITSCEDDPRAVGRTGRIVDELPPNELTDFRWTVNRIAWHIAPVLVHAHEITPTGR